MTLGPQLEKIRAEVESVARSMGLDFFETVFEVVDFEMMNEVASYGGFPSRYPHWRFGMEYEQASKGYRYGLQKIYELVINNDPCYAYLLDVNTPVDQKMVIAHVYAHSDFFKNNAYFESTNRHMVDELANHSTRVQKYSERFGLEKVESFLDAVLSIEDLIDPHSVFIQRSKGARLAGGEDEEREKPRRLKSKPYMESFINPKEFLEEQERLLREKAERGEKFPPEPVRDIMLFLIENAPLKDWERDVLSMIREESYYFAPQAQTKIMNEGWATFWHTKIMTERCLEDSELIDYADHHSGTVATGPGVLNPYKLGLELFRDIEERWNAGRFGPEYEECRDLTAKREWDKNLGLGLEEVFHVRKVHNDVTFVDTYLTEEFCREHRLFSFQYDAKKEEYQVASREFEEIKRHLLFSLTNSGKPFVHVEDANFDNRGELLLAHRHEGIDLHLPYARSTIENLHRFWKRPVRLRTVVDGTGRLLTFDGREHSEEAADAPRQEELL